MITCSYVWYMLCSRFDRALKSEVGFDSSKTTSYFSQTKLAVGL